MSICCRCLRYLRSQLRPQVMQKLQITACASSGVFFISSKMEHVLRPCYKMVLGGIFNFENAKSFLPRSFSEAPM